MKFLIPLFACLSAYAIGCKVPAMCVDNIRINWWNIPPYIHSEQNETVGTGDLDAANVNGIMKKIVELLVKDCCGECVTITYLQPHKNVVDLKIGENGSVLNLPVYGKRNTEKYVGLPYIPILESPGIIYLTKLPADGDTARVVIASALRAGYILIIGLLMAAIAGILMWMLDSYINYEEFPKNFFWGVWKGFWWSLVTMTTVGYGDKVPKTVLARTLAIVWIIIGTVINALFNGAVTSAMTANSLDQDTSIFGKKVVVLNSSEEKKYAVRSNAIVTEVNTIADFAAKVTDTDNYHGGLIDSYLAGFNEEHFKAENRYYITNTIDYQFMYGIVLSNEFANDTMSKCLVRATSLRESYVSKLLSEKIHALDEMNKEKFKSLTTSVFSATSPVFQSAAIYCVVIIAVLVTFGFAWQFFFHPRRSSENEVEPEYVEGSEVIRYESPKEMIVGQLREMEDAMIAEVLVYVVAFRKRQADLRKLMNNPVLKSQMPNIIALEDVHFAKYE